MITVKQNHNFLIFRPNRLNFLQDVKRLYHLKLIAVQSHLILTMECKCFQPFLRCVFQINETKIINKHIDVRMIILL